MKLALAATMMLATLVVSSCSTTGTGVSAGIEISSAPPPPALDYGVNPQWRYITDRGVYVLDDDDAQYDLFRFGTWTYLYSNGYWYRSSAYGGPFIVVEQHRVPQAIFQISDREYRWRNHPSAWRPNDRDRDRDRY